MTLPWWNQGAGNVFPRRSQQDLGGFGLSANGELALGAGNDRWFVAVAVVVLLATAGCLGLGEEDTDTAGEDVDTSAAAEVDTPTDGSPGSLGLSDCIEHWGVFPVPVEEIRHKIPEGFEHTGWLVDNPNLASVVVYAARCQTPDGSPVEMIGANLPVTPPEAYEAENVTSHNVELARLTSNATVAETIEAWGSSAVEEGEIDLEIRQPPGTGVGTSQGRAGDDKLDLSTTVQGTPETWSGGLSRKYAVEHGEVVGAYETAYGERQVLWAGEALLGSASALSMTPENAGTGGLLWDVDFTYRDVDLEPAKVAG